MPYPATCPSLSFAFKSKHCVVATFFSFFFSFPPTFFPFPLSLVSLSLFLLFCFLCHGSGPFCDRILFRNLILSSSPIFFDFAAPLRFLNLDVASGSQFGMRTWFKFILYFKTSHSLLSPLVHDTMSYSSHAFQKLIITSFVFFFYLIYLGFYTLSPTPPHNLILAPFHGKPACQIIHPGQGVCGTAFSSKRPLLIPDTHAFPGHIACDAESRSEIVIPIFLIGPEGQDRQAKKALVVVGVIDVDCKVENGFDQVDVEWLTRLAELIGRSCDWVTPAAGGDGGGGGECWWWSNRTHF